MLGKKKIKVVEPEEVVVEEEVVETQPHVVVHQERWGSGTNTLVSDQLPSLDD